MSISSVFSVGSGLVLPSAATRRTYAVTPAEASLNAAAEAEASSSNVAARVTSARYATRSLGIEDLSALVAEAQVRARTIELFGSGSRGSNGSSATVSSDWAALSQEPGLREWATSESPSLSSFGGIEQETGATDSLTSSLLSDPADENGDGYVSLSEEVAYSRTHWFDSAESARERA